MPKLLQEVYRLQDSIRLDEDERLLLKMFANLLESHYQVEAARNRLTVDEYNKIPGKWELWHGMLRGL